MKIYAKKMKEEYNSLLKSGMFWEFHPELSGNFDNDKVQYKKIYRKIQKFRKLYRQNSCQSAIQTRLP